MRRISPSLFLAAPLLAGTILLPGAAAQTSTGSLNGVVSDSTGAVIAGVSLTMTNTATGVSRAIATNSSGYYALNEVPAGSYTLSARKQGFGTVVEKGIVLGVNQTLTHNIVMKVGSQDETVTVEASTQQLESSSSELGTVVSAQATEDLPLNGREFTQLLTLTPGASRLNTSQNSSGGRAPAGPGPIVLPAMHGQDNRNNYFMLDGINDNEDLFSSFAVSPTVDDIAEFKVQAHNDSAQFGMVLGGVINVVTKSGTNHLHGAAWEFNRNQALGALNPITGTNPALNQNQFGGSIGGPVRLPHIYDGRNRTFFYFSYEGFRKSQNSSSLKTTLTQDELNGNFGAFLPSTKIYNPFVVSRPAYINNFIDPSTFNPVMVAYAKAFLPIVPAGSPVTNNYVDTTPTTTNQNNLSGRLDESFGPHNSVWFRYSHIDQPSITSGGYAGLLNQTDVNATNYGVNYLHLFNDTTTLDLQFGHNVLNSISAVRYSEGTSSALVNKIGFSPAFACGYAAQGADTDCLVPALSITGYTGSGESNSYSDPATGLYQFSGDFSKLKGRHFLQAGAAYYFDNFHQQAVGATVGFASVGTANASSSGGNALASFLLGVVDNSKDRATVVPVNGQKEFGGYLQDQWKVRPNLTVNFGVRYDTFFWPRYGDSGNLSDAIGEIDFSNGTYILQRSVGDCATLKQAPCIPGGLAGQANVVVSPNGVLWDNSYDNWQPRAGFAWTPRQGTIVRAGFGIFFDEWSGIRQTVQGIGGDWPSVTQPSAQNQDLPANGIPTVNPANPLNGTTSLPAATPFTQSTYYRDPHAKNPKSYQYNFGMQQVIDSHTILELDYVGSKNTRLPIGGGLYNVATTAAAGTSAQVAARRPYPNITPTRYDRSIGYGNYNGLETRLSRTLSKGLQFIVSYTWSKTMNLACDGLFGVEGCSEQNPYDLRDDYSVAGYDLPNNLSVSGTYELPIGAGKGLNIKNRVAAGFLGGWQVNTVYAMTSGVPFTVTTTGDIANTGNTNEDRGQVIGNPHAVHPTRAQWFNTAAYTTPALYTFGNSGRNSLRGQVFHNVDASLFKKVNTGEGTHLEFRLEAFNALNHLTLGTPAANVSTPSSFGQITSERSMERQVQVAVKFVY